MKSLFLYSVLIISLASCNQSTRFELLSGEKTGITFRNDVVEQDTFNIMRNEYMYNGGGVGVGDLNNDGFQDLIFSGNKVLTRIYLNRGDFTFQDITSSFEGLTSNQWISGVCIVDINADGLRDIYLTSTMSQDSASRRNQLWINQGIENGIPHFKEMAKAYGIDDDAHSMHAAFFDYDLDGDLDLYVLNNIVNRAVPTNYRVKITDGSAINNDHLFQNQGNGTFKEVTREAGIVYEGYGLGIAIGDVNQDGYPDLYISNDYIANDLLYLNQRNGTFKNVAEEYISYQSRFSMGNDMADFNNDGLLDIITMDMMPEQYFRKKQTINGNSYYIYINNKKYGYQPQFVRNMLHVHNGFIDTTMLPYSEVAQLAGVYQTEWSWSPLFADFDNDGDKDLLVTNGFPKDLTDKDFTNYKAQVYGSLADDEHMLERIPIVKVPNYAFENVGSLKFSKRTEEWGMNLPSFSNGASFVDLDNDGDLDYVVNNINDPAFIYKNQTIGDINDHKNFLRLELTGLAPNTEAIGAKVELWLKGQLQYSEKYLSRGYISSVEPILHFGLGDQTEVDSIKIVWPLGRSVTVLKEVSSNQILRLHEKDANPRDPGIRLKKSKPMFEPADSLIDYTHTQEDYIDFFQGQSLIPHKYSQIGPVMNMGDLTDDGLPDLLVGGSKDQPTTFFRNTGNQFVRTELEGLTGNKPGQESDLIILDIDQDQDQDVIITTGGYTLEDTTQYRHYVYRNDNGKFSKEELPIKPFIASIVRAADFDKDGDQDIFIGCRVKRWRFPTANPSSILVNENGKYVSRPELNFDLGMVTDAVWTDYDQDGWIDLLITREWNSLALLRNTNGVLKEVKLPELEAKHGLWFSLAAGDFDADGDTDFVVGNLGLNHRFTISDEFPMRVYALDLDKNGFIDPVSTAYWRDEQGEMQQFPINYFDELASQSPFFRKLFTSYTKFSYTKAQDIIKPDTISKVNTYFVNTTSSYILINDQGKFIWQELPVEAQLAPIRKVIVTDFNSDGRADILIAGNDNTYDVSTGYYAASKGLLMLGQEKLEFKVVPPAKSGIVLNGQVESLLYFESQGVRYVLGGINRKGITTFRLIK